MDQPPQSAPEQAPPIPRDRIDPDARKILDRLDRFGFPSYLVGGCVRDLLLDRHPKDFDIATDARPRQVKRLFRNSRIIGRRFRLVHIQFGDRIFEVSTFRAPPEKEQGDDPLIRQDNVYGTEVEDAFRRDFTINGLFYDPIRERLVDHVGGVADLRAGVVRTIGEAEVRLREDPVRILRAARFAGRLDFHLDPAMRAAAIAHREDLRKSAAPRVLEEIYRLVSGQGASHAFRLLAELGAIEPILPEILPLPERFFEALERLGTLTEGSRTAVPQSMLISTLLSPAVLPALAKPGAPHDHERQVQEILRPAALRLTVARHDTTRARQCLAAQARFLQPPATRGDRRFAFHDYFREALALRRVLGPVLPLEADPLALWEEVAGGGEPAQGEGPPRRRRRGRRGGRRRRPLRENPPQGTDGACPSPTGSSSAPAPNPP